MNLRWSEGTWTKAVYTGEGEPVCESTVEYTLGMRFCPIYPRWRPGVTNEKAPNFPEVAERDNKFLQIMAENNV